MKSAFFALALASPAFAASFDMDGFGQRLNGWTDKGAAIYDFTDAKYRTHRPTITATSEGGLFISTQVDLMAFGDSGAVSHIDMTFSTNGTLLSAQLRSTLGRKTIDTGLVRRPEAPEAPVVAEGKPASVAKPFHATEELIIELFNRFNMEMRKITEGKDAEKRDLFSRLGGSKDAKSANLAAGLRHNCNLMIQHVGER